MKIIFIIELCLAMVLICIRIDNGSSLPEEYIVNEFERSEVSKQEGIQVDIDNQKWRKYNIWQETLTRSLRGSEPFRKKSQFLSVLFAIFYSTNTNFLTKN